MEEAFNDDEIQSDHHFGRGKQCSDFCHALIMLHENPPRQEFAYQILA